MLQTREVSLTEDISCNRRSPINFYPRVLIHAKALWNLDKEKPSTSNWFRADETIQLLNIEYKLINKYQL
jgi:hypothetical protein